MEKNQHEQHEGNILLYFRQTMRIMRLSVFFMVVGTAIAWSATTYSQSTKLSVNLKDATVRDVIKAIEEQSDFLFLFQEGQVDLNRRVSIRAEGKQLQEILDEVFKGTDNIYIVSDRQVVIGKAPRKNLEAQLAVLQKDLKTVIEQPQQREITGKVTDSSGNPLPGATVMVKGTTIGAVTDANGNFSLRIPANAQTLQVSFVGMKTKEIPISGRTMFEIILEEEAIGLQEVVAVGYGTQKKTSLTAAVGTVKGEKLVSSPVAQTSSAISGRIAGVISAQSSGEIGKDYTSIKIRGLATTGNTNPLVVVDGIPRDFNSLDPNTIESISILKDAAAVAPYGMAGANGVILVTTKKGKEGKPILSYNGYIGFQNPTIVPDMMNSYEYAVMKNDAVKNQNPAANLPFSEEDILGFKKSVEKAPDADFDKYPNSDAINFIRNKNVPITSHSLSISGGNDRGNYYMSIGYLGQQGMWTTLNNDKYSVSLSLEAKPTETTIVGLSLNASRQKIKSPSADGTLVFNKAMDYLPTRAIYYTNGLLGHSNGVTLESLIKNGSNSSNHIRAYTQLSVEQLLPFLPGLSVKGVFSYDPDIYYTKNWTEPEPTYYNINTNTTPYTYTPVVSTQKPSLLESQTYGFASTGQILVNYNQSFGRHEVGGLFVFEARKNKSNSFFASRTNYDIWIPELSMGNSDRKFFDNGGSSLEQTQCGYIYRLTYAYDNRYLFEGAGRYDGHYYFAPGKKFGFFPSFSLGWRLSEEKFVKDNFSWIDNLKLRGSWGQSGNLAGGPFQYSSAMQIYGQAYVIDGTIYQGIREQIEPNPDITWEKANKVDVGFDFMLWKGLFGMEFDYFYEKRDNMLVSPAAVVPAEYGIGLAQINAGIVRNHGLDFTLTSERYFSNGFAYDVNFNFTYAKNKIIEIFENPVTRDDPNRSRTGRPIGTPFGLKAIGLFQKEDFNSDGSLKEGIPNHTFFKVEPGDIRYADVNGDKKIDASDETALGYPALPQIIYGFNPNLFYKGFNLSLVFQGSGQSSIFLSQQLAYPFLTGGNVARIHKDYWRPDNTDARFPRPFGEGGNANNFQRTNNSWYKYSGAYLRLKNIEFGYTLPRDISNSLKVQNVKIYLSGQNLVTWSSLNKVIDPEMDNSAVMNNTRGWFYPHQKVISFGLNLTL
jgi:TonB-linked SusC/RagA family outer membrane protein